MISFFRKKVIDILVIIILISLSKEMSNSDNSVEVINKMGSLKAQGFKNYDYDGKILFEGEVEFVIYE